MQTYSAVVRLAGDLNNTVAKTGMTAAEITILKHIHGPQSVVEVARGGTASGDNEASRLKQIYGDRVFTECYPGATPALPDALPGEQPEAQPKATKPA